MMSKIFDVRPCLSREEITEYLTGSLTETKRFEIENHLLDCPLCSDAVDGIRGFQGVVANLPAESKLNFSGKKQDIVLAKKTNWFRLAAVFTGIVVFTALLFQYFTDSNSQKIFAGAYKRLPPPESQTRSAGDSLTTDTVDEAMVLYGQNRFEEAISAFEIRLKDLPTDSQSYLYAGICYLETGKTNTAIDYFKKARINSEQFYPEATWYLALAYLKEGSNQQAVHLLEELAQTDNDFTQKAKELQADISR